MRYPNPALPWPILPEAVNLLAEVEQGPGGGMAKTAYLCPAGRWTIAWGETDDVHPGDTCTEVQGDNWLLDDLIERSRAVQEMCTVAPSLHELSALVLLAYNIGLRDDKKKAGLYHSSVLRCHNAGDKAGAAQAFSLYKKGRDPVTKQLVVFPGLVIRRAKEAAMYLTPDGPVPHVPSPQVVEPPPPVTASPTLVGSTAATGIGGVALVLSTFKDIGTQVTGLAKDFAADLGVTPLQVLAGLLVAYGVFVIHRRWLDYKAGVK